MKLSILFLLLVSSAYSQTCEKLLEIAQTDVLYIGELNEIEGILVDEDVKAPLFSSSLMADDEVAAYIGEFDAKDCEEALSQVDVLVNDSILEFVYTSEDSCDGGNSYGYIKEGNVAVGVITDSEIYCL
tara:strand:+ start:143976 stop:144362 length:387 start_codon:yes stop_codon:yes gene_type:complete